MAKSQESFNKKEKEKKRNKKRQEKLERSRQRKLEKAEKGAKTFEEMLSYVDENGNLSSTPPDPAKMKINIKVEDIIIGAPPRDDTPFDPIRKGKVKFFNDEKGYGFIVDSETKESVFVHMNNLAEPIRENDTVSFEVEMGPKGPNAIRVKIAPLEPKVKAKPEAVKTEETSAKEETPAKEESVKEGSVEETPKAEIDQAE